MKLGEKCGVDLDKFEKLVPCTGCLFDRHLAPIVASVIKDSRDCDLLSPGVENGQAVKETEEKTKPKPKKHRSELELARPSLDTVNESELETEEGEESKQEISSDSWDFDDQMGNTSQLEPNPATKDELNTSNVADPVLKVKKEPLTQASGDVSREISSNDTKLEGFVPKVAKTVPRRFSIGSPMKSPVVRQTRASQLRVDRAKSQSPTEHDNYSPRPRVTSMLNTGPNDIKSKPVFGAAAGLFK